MKQRLLTALIATFVYFVIANLEILFSVSQKELFRHFGNLFSFSYSFSLLGYRNNRKNNYRKD